MSNRFFLFMPVNSKFETFYVQSKASECDSGYIFLPEDQYVDPIVLNEILEANNSFPCNATGKLEVWTTTPTFSRRVNGSSLTMSLKRS